MAKKFEPHKSFNVAVVGFSGTEREKGVEGIGKSCFCNRFIRPNADDYREDHISVLSQSDFGGRVVNNDHFLYWGDSMITSNEAILNFHVIEQTEFIDDTSFHPFRSGKTDPYYKRCANTKLTSAEKLMYICKNQLGLEHEFEEKVLPDGKISIDGFLCLFDVSKVDQRPFERQLEYTNLILNNIIKTKKPVVFVTTKNDRANDTFVREAEKLINKQKGNITIIETSAHENVNISLCYLVLAHLIDRTKIRPKIITYNEAYRIRKDKIDSARTDYKYCIRSLVMDHRAMWMPTYRAIHSKDEFLTFIELEGLTAAKRIFDQHVYQLLEEFRQRRADIYLEKLKSVLETLLPDLTIIADRSWPNILRWMTRQSYYLDHFVPLSEGKSWSDREFLESQENRIPYDFLENEESAEDVFRNHVNFLRAEFKRAELRKQFRQLLVDTQNICPGKSLNEVAIFFLGRECFTSLSEEDKQSIYEQHQIELKENARKEFQELLNEHADYFVKLYEATQNEIVTNNDLEDIIEMLQYEPRYKALCRLEEDRKVMLLNHLGFLEHPSRECCPAGVKCAESIFHEILSMKSHRPLSWCNHSQFILSSESHQLNLVILGANGLADSFFHDLRSQCVNDEYTLDDVTYNLDYRLLDSDVTLPHNSFCTTNFTSHGCFCIYNSDSTLKYLCDSISKTVLSIADKKLKMPFHGLPIIVLLAHDPTATEKGIKTLREEGHNLSEMLQCPFIDIPSSLILGKSNSFYEAQVKEALHQLLYCIKLRSSLNSSNYFAEGIEPDLRVVICCMCGDEYDYNLLLDCILNHQCCYLSSGIEDRYPLITIDTQLDGARRSIEITFTSFHGFEHIKSDLYHGYYIVYCANRKASYISLSALMMTLLEIPTRILCVTENSSNILSYPNFSYTDFSYNYVNEGQLLADRKRATFEIVFKNSSLSLDSFTSFFKEVWLRKYETESAFSFSDDDDSEPLTFGSTERSLDHISPPSNMNIKNPWYPSKCLFQNTSTSNSADDSEPLYDQLQLNHRSSDSDDERCSSSSPTVRPTPPHNPYATVAIEDIGYYDCGQEDTEHLIQSGDAKSKCCVLPDFERCHVASRPKSAWYEDMGYHPSSQNGHIENPAFDVGNKPFYPMSSPSSKTKQKVLDSRKYSDVRLASCPREFNSLKSSKDSHNIEISEYAQVKDALGSTLGENEYAQVADVVPAGKLHRIKSTFRNKLQQDVGSQHNASDSDSECSSVDKDIYAKVQRRPTPHKKKHRSGRHSDSSLPPPLPPHFCTEKNVPLAHDQSLKKDRSNSLSDGSRGSGDEEDVQVKQKRILSFRRKKHVESDSLIIGQPWSDSDMGVPFSNNKSILDGFSINGTHLGKNYEDKDDYDEESENRFWRRWNLREKDPEKTRRKEEEKKLRDEEKRTREELKKKKTEEKLSKIQRKLRKKIVPGINVPNNVMDFSSIQYCENSPIPLFVKKCVDYIEDKGLLVEGIYRVPGNRAHVDLLFEKFKEDPYIDIATLDIPVNAIATALKGFFNELSSPLIPSNFYEELLKTCDIRIKNMRYDALKKLISKFPENHFIILKYLTSHISKVAQSSSVNSMDAKNLAICWWPTLFRPEFTSMEILTLTSKLLENIVIAIFEENTYFFSNDEHVV